MLTMTAYKVRIDESAERDILELTAFLTSVMSRGLANRYIDAMLSEIYSLSIFADLYRSSRYADIRAIHPAARHMVSHNKKWAYIFHIEDDTVIIDRIRSTKLIKR